MGRSKLIEGLEEVVSEEESRSIMVGRGNIEDRREERLERLSEFLNNHSKFIIIIKIIMIKKRLMCDSPTNSDTSKGRKINIKFNRLYLQTFS